jgi:hypothetical protein
MKILIGTLIALAIVVGIVAPASALDAKTFYETADRNHY